MIQINLLPVRVKKKQELARQFASAYFLSIGLVLAIIASLWISSDREISSLNGRLKNVKSEVAKYARFELVLQELTKRKEIVDKKRNLIKDLQTDRDASVRVLALLAIQVPPEKIWIDKLNLRENSMNLNGVALSNEAIVEFMRNLEASPYIEKGSINLVQSRQIELKNMKLREFEVAYRYYPFSVIKKNMKM
jgi:type IV pilus assembly protein PilN